MKFVHCFSPFYAQKWIANVDLFLRGMGAIGSCCALQKSNREQFAQVAHDKRATGAIDSLFFTSELLFHSFALSLKNNEQNAQKTDEQIPNPVFFPIRYTL